LVENTDFSLPHLYLAPTLGITRWSVAEIFGTRKLESLGYHICVILLLAGVVGLQCRFVSDRRTDGRTEGQTHARRQHIPR